MTELEETAAAATPAKPATVDRMTTFSNFLDKAATAAQQGR